MSFDEEHLDEHYLCQREVAERDHRIRKLEAALHKICEADCRGEVCKGIACVALNVAYPMKRQDAATPLRRLRSAEELG
jgi:hypothetical protein